jgi:hypothetical protein
MQRRTFMDGILAIRRSYAAACAFDLSEVLEAYVETQRISMDTALEHADELKRFLSIRAGIDGPATDGRFAIGMDSPIDDLWHIFLLYSPTYVRFCHAVSGFYIHHRPNPRSMSVSEEAARLLNLFNAYEVAFGHPPRPHLWPDRQTVVTAEVDPAAVLAIDDREPSVPMS